MLLLTGAQSSCEQRTASSSSNGSESRVESRVESSAGSSGGSGSSASSSSRVKYSVTSDARLKSVTFIDRGGNKTTRTFVGSSWSGTGPSSHGTVMVSATAGSGSTMLKCSITVKGRVVQQASAVGGGSTTVVCTATY